MYQQDNSKNNLSKEPPKYVYCFRDNQVIHIQSKQKQNKMFVASKMMDQNFVKNRHQTLDRGQSLINQIHINNNMQPISQNQKLNRPIESIQKLNSFVANPQKQRFSQLLKKLHQLSITVEINEKFQQHYNHIGLTRKNVIDGLKTIYEYFVLIGEQIDKGIIKKQIGHRLVEGVHQYLQMEKFQQLHHKNKAIYILEFQTKFSVCLQFFKTIKDHQQNITCEQKEKYKDVWKDIEIVQAPKSSQIRKKYNFVKKIMIITTMAILNQQQIEWGLIKKVFFGLSYPRYMLDYPTARLKSFMFYKYPTIKLAAEIWNIPEFGATREFAKIGFESIEVNQKIYIPADFAVKQYQNDPYIYLPTQNSIQVRVLHHEKLLFRAKPKKRSFLCVRQSDESQFKQIESIIVHMHGGGFIALSSRMMQTMTRRWANQLKIPIFSIDYRKPPENPFPTAPNDCLAVYKFIVTRINKYMNINPKNIYLVGDSAGGNLACSLMGNILINKLPEPKGLYLAYPALDLRILFSPSKIHAVTDPLLWPSMLLLCLNEYLGNKSENGENPLASPILLTEQFVGGEKGDKRFPLNWPKTMIIVGQRDPLYDDSLLLMQKMKQSNIECSCRAYSQFSHGFLSTNFMISQCQQTVKDSIKDLKQMTSTVGQKIIGKLSKLKKLTLTSLLGRNKHHDKTHDEQKKQMISGRKNQQ